MKDELNVAYLDKVIYSALRFQVHILSAFEVNWNLEETNLFTMLKKKKKKVRQACFINLKKTKLLSGI